MVTAPIPGRKLGRKPPQSQTHRGRFMKVVTSDGKTRYFARMGENYTKAKDLQPPPAGPLNRGTNAPAQTVISQMYLNDQEGDCVIASRKHKVGILNANEFQTTVIATDAETQADYVAACGAGDQGCDMSAVNQYEQQTGMMMTGVRHPIDGTATVDWTNQNLVMVLIDIFGTIDVGMNLPQGWYQSNDGADWGIVTGADAQIVGGHEVQAYDYDAEGVWILTWGGKRRILWAAFTSTQWLDEVYTSLAKDWYNNGNLAPNGIDVATLQADLAMAASGQVPPIGGTVPPTPPPGPTPSPLPPPPAPDQVTFTSLTATIPMGFLGRFQTSTYIGTGIVNANGTATFSSEVQPSKRNSTQGVPTVLLTDSEKRALLHGPIRRNLIESGAIDSAGFDATVARFTNKDGTINWAGLAAFFIAIEPALLALITALGG